MVFCGNVARSMQAMAEEHLVTITDDFVTAMEFACFQQATIRIMIFFFQGMAVTIRVADKPQNALSGLRSAEAREHRDAERREAWRVRRPLLKILHRPNQSATR
jgi:hypothetical protein